MTSLGRLVDLVRQKDFLNGSLSPNGVRALPEAPHRLLSYGTITAHELGVVAIVVALVGLVAIARRRRLGDTLFFVIVLLGNLALAVFIAGLNDASGIWSGLVVGGFLIDLVLVSGVLVGLGADALGDLAVAVARRARARGGGERRPAAPVRNIVLVIVALAVLVPSIVVHEPFATHRGVSYADDSVQQVLNQLPKNAVLIVWGWEFMQPYVYRQVVEGERRDVKVLDGSELNLRWYREEVVRTFGAMAPSPALDTNSFLAALLRNAVVNVSVFVDMSAAGQFVGKFGLIVDGAAAELVPGTSIAGHRSLTVMSQELHAVQQRAGGSGQQHNDSRTGMCRSSRCAPSSSSPRWPNTQASNRSRRTRSKPRSACGPTSPPCDRCSPKCRRGTRTRQRISSALRPHTDRRRTRHRMLRRRVPQRDTYASSQSPRSPTTPDRSRVQICLSEAVEAVPSSDHANAERDIRNACRR